MKNKFTKNIGLKIVSLFAAFFLWLVVVNVDDPVISRTYSGIQVGFLNTDVLEEEGKSYEVINGTDTINVVVSAKRSVLDEISKDDIRAVADFEDMTHNGLVPIEVKCSRYSDRIDSVTTRTENLKLLLEDIIEKTMAVSVTYEGELAEGYMIDSVDTSVKSVVVSGPQSLIEKVCEVVAGANVTEIKKDTVITQVLKLYDENGKEIDDNRVSLNEKVSEISIIVNPIKEIPIASGYSGTPVAGYAVSGTAITSPSSVRISGRGENYDDIDVIYISPDDVTVEGAMADVNVQVDISDYLPTGVVFADIDFDPLINVTVGIAETQRKIISVPVSNITVENIPDGYIANVVDVGTVEVEIQGLGDTFERYSGDLAIGTIDALSLISRSGVDSSILGVPVQSGENDGIVSFDFPSGISAINPVSMMVIVDYVGDIELKNVPVEDLIGEDDETVESADATDEDDSDDSSSDEKASEEGTEEVTKKSEDE